MVIFIIVLVVVLIFCLLLKQSRKPSGLLGRVMMTIWNRFYEPMVKWSLKQHLGNPKEVLDIGVGNGLSTKLLSQALPKAKCLGVDYAPGAIKAARRFESQQRQFQVADVTVLPFKEGRFQLVTAFQTHFHWDDLNKGLAESYRVLATGGEMIIACERNKVAYYLKEQVDLKAAQIFFESFGFVEIVIKENQAWVAYYLQKK